MTQVCYEGTYFSAQLILYPANNFSWTWHTVAALLAIWDYPKSWAHLATLPFPKPQELGNAQKICWTHMTSYQSYGTLRSESGMCLICPNHECAHVWTFTAIFHFFCPPCTMLSPPVHAGRMDQWTIYDMGVTYIGPHGSHTTWAKRSILR